MNIYELSKNELELMSYQDIALAILKEEKRKMSTIEIFKIIAGMLDFTENQYEKRLEDFFATLSTNKNFILLEDGNWDLKSNHAVKIITDDEDEIEEENYDDNEEDEIEEEDYDDVDNDDDIIDEDEDDLEELTIISEDEEPEE